MASSSIPQLPLTANLSPARFVCISSFKHPNRSQSYHINTPSLPFRLLKRWRDPSLLTKRFDLCSVRASAGDAVVPEEAVEKAQEVVSAAASDDSIGSTVIAVLLSVAFAGLSVLTVGVIYIAVTDFLQKREKDKFEKEEAANKKKGKKKVKARAKTGPRGFGQKIEEEDDD